MSSPQYHRWLLYMLLAMCAEAVVILVSPYVPLGLLAAHGMLIIAVSLAAGGLWIIGFWAYWKDAQTLRDSVDGWPSLGWYLVGHALLAPVTALVYLARRDTRVGTDYGDTIAARLPGVN